MGAFSIWHWLIVLAVVLLLFGGRGKISALMGDFGKGLKSFKQGLKEEGEIEGDEAKAIKAEAANTSEAEPESKKAAKG
jgi:sec-independent protein translocase protein TatA